MRNKIFKYKFLSTICFITFIICVYIIKSHNIKIIGFIILGIGIILYLTYSKKKKEYINVINEKMINNIYKEISKNSKYDLIYDDNIQMHSLEKLKLLNITKNKNSNYLIKNSNTLISNIEFNIKNNYLLFQNTQHVFNGYFLIFDSNTIDNNDIFIHNKKMKKILTNNIIHITKLKTNYFNNELDKNYQIYYKNSFTLDKKYINAIKSLDKKLNNNFLLVITNNKIIIGLDTQKDIYFKNYHKKIDNEILENQITKDIINIINTIDKK